MSDTTSRPPGLSTRKALENGSFVVGKLDHAVEITTSTEVPGERPLLDCALRKLAFRIPALFRFAIPNISSVNFDSVGDHRGAARGRCEQQVEPAAANQGCHALQR